jgi:hypothetical protein
MDRFWGSGRRRGTNCFEQLEDKLDGGMIRAVPVLPEPKSREISKGEGSRDLV